MKTKFTGMRAARMRAALAAVSLVLMSLIGITPPAFADATLCSGTSFSTCINAGYTAHDYENHYTTSYWRAESGHNCTNYVGYMLTRNGAQSPGVLMGNGKDWDTSAASLGYTVDTTPAVGSIAQWDTGIYGHVAYVEAVGTNSITVSEDNASPYNTFAWRTITTSGSWPSHFLHIKDVQRGSTTPGTVRTVDGQLWWHLRNSSSSGAANASFSYGLSADIPLAGDWDGNGASTIGIVRAASGALWWHLRNDNSSGAASASFSYGLPTDVPIVGDWDGDGTETPGIVRSVDGQFWWHLRNSNSSGAADVSFAYGLSTDTPVVGDWDGNGASTIGIVRAASGALWWHLRNDNSSGAASASFSYGLPTDVPVSGDWDNNNSGTPGIIRSVDGVRWWHLRNSNSSGSADTSFSYGLSTDIPVVGDWDGS